MRASAMSVDVEHLKGSLMARGPTPKPTRPFLTHEEKLHVIGRLNKRIEEVRAFDPDLVQKRFGSPQLSVLEVSIAETLAAAFGQDTPEFNRYSRARSLDHGPIAMGIGFGEGPSHTDRPEQFRGYLREGQEEAIALLGQAVRSLEEELPPGTLPVQSKPASLGRKVFIVHGRDQGPREAVARFLEGIKFHAIILHEQANQGRTVIEKIEANDDASFAVVILTPDDEGALRGEAIQPRARQNVILELGYFLGKLGRDRVCTLKAGELEIPSDWRGVVDEPFEGTSWKQTLARELEAAGYEIDWNKVMRP